MFPHEIHLQTVHRQSEEKLIKSVNELEKGTHRKGTNEFLSTLDRPLEYENHADVVKLFAKNDDVDLYNYQILMSMEGELKIFESADTGDERFLRKILAPKRLGVKLNAPVMLLRNLNERHVNGLIGKVVQINDDSIYVNFEVFGKSEIVKIERYSFTKYDPNTNKCIASRLQFPLRLAFAMTIHKAQGMTLPLVEVNCKNAKFPGQIGVAFGRAKSSKGLRVINYNPYLCKPHSKEVRDFYEQYNPTQTYELNLSCCRNYETFEDVIPTAADGFEFDSEIDDLIASVEEVPDSDHKYAGASKVDESDIQNLLEIALTDYVDTPVETKTHIAHKSLLEKGNTLSLWYAYQRSNIEKLYETNCTVQTRYIKQKHLTEFYTEFQSYIESADYSLSIKSLSDFDFSRQLLTSVIFLIKANVLKTKSASVDKPVNIGPSIFPSPDSTPSEPGKSKIRHVGGYCVAKVRYRLTKSTRNCFFVPGMQPEIEKFQEQINILDNMTVSAYELMETTIYKETLEEMARKQNTSEGLTNICDAVYDFL